MLRTMRDEAGVQPDVITYSALISACAKGQPRSSSGRSATVAEMAELIDVRASRQLGRLVRRERERDTERTHFEGVGPSRILGGVEGAGGKQCAT